MKSLISWPGNKHRQLQQLLSFVPEYYTDEVAICEPFFGTGAFTLEMVQNTNGPVFAAEGCAPLRNWWLQLMAVPEDMARLMAQFRTDYSEAGRDRDIFDALRDGCLQLIELGRDFLSGNDA